MSAIDTVILDFDGTFTDVEVEAAPFKDAFRANVQDLLGRDVTRLWAEEERVVLSRPNEFGWEFGGRTVAPATADPYLLCTAVMQRIFDRLAVISGLPLRTEVSQAIYRDSYRYTAIAFRPEAREVLEALLAGPYRVFVVTNSHTDVVSKKIDQLAPRGRERVTVMGDAKKYVIEDAFVRDERWRSVPEQRTIDGLPGRPIWLRRGRYYDVLSHVWTEAKSEPSRTLVVGDIWELDLALPQELGAHVHLLERPSLLDYERHAVGLAGARGGMSVNLRGVLSRLGLEQSR